MAASLVQEFLKGFREDLPPFRLVLGLCPVLAVTRSVENGVGMGLATTFVLVCSNFLISALRHTIPPKVRIACYILIIATFVTVVDLLMQAYTYPLYRKLGIFIPLIVVNCIVLGRAEAFASKNGILPSLADGLGIGLGFTASLMAIGTVREIIGNGTFFGHGLFGPDFVPFRFMVEAPGAFVTLGLLLFFMNLAGNRR